MPLYVRTQDRTGVYDVDSLIYDIREVDGNYEVSALGCGEVITLGTYSSMEFTKKELVSLLTEILDKDDTDYESRKSTHISRIYDMPERY